MAEALAAKIVQKIKAAKIDPGNAIEIVKAVVKAAKGDADAAVRVVDLLANGLDGVAGTSDDIPESTIRVLKVLLENQLVADFMVSRGSCAWLSSLGSCF